MLIALGIFISLRFLTGFRFRICVAAAAVLTIFLGVLSEAAQIQGPRDASFSDLLADWLGAASALILLLALARSSPLRRKSRTICAAIGIGLLLLALQPLISVSAAYIERNHNVPVLFSSDSWFGSRFLRLQNSSFDLVNDSQRQEQVATVTFDKEPWPGLVFHDIWPDWTEYSTLTIEMASTDSETVELQIRVHDKTHNRGNQPFSDRFNMAYTLKSGHHLLRIPLKQIRLAPSGREMDLSQIHGLVIFTTENEIGKSFNLKQIRLEE